VKRTFIALLTILTFSCVHAKPVIAPTAPLTPSNIALVETALLSVGHLTGTMTEDGRTGTYGCTAFSIDVRKFMTAAHCIGDQMVVDGHPATLVAKDDTADLAVIIADDVKPALHFRQAPLVRQEGVVALGYGYSWKYPTITHHFVMILDFTPETDMVPGVWFSGGFIGGMSGGPVLDLTGHVVSIVQRSNEEAAYGVSVATMMKFLHDSSTVVILD
jgi:Trypsin-like peptidase domain